jgi:hypothetical protein
MKKITKQKTKRETVLVPNTSTSVQAILVAEAYLAKRQILENVLERELDD